MLRDVTTLEGGIKIYKEANIGLIDCQPDDVYPLAKYVLKSHLKKLTSIRENLLQKGIDILYLDEIFSDENIAIAPPVIEFSEPDLVPVLVDGIHRLWMARKLGLPVRSIYITGSNPNLPVISLPVSWDEVSVWDKRPDRPEDRRIYRQGINEDNINSYYRDLSVLGSSGRRYGDTR